MKTKAVLALAALSYAPLTMAGDKSVYPAEKVAEFIVEKLDVTSLPAAMRPKKEKGKKTFADYGFTAQEMVESEAIIQAAGGAKKLSIKVLDQRPSGIYVCVTEPGQNTGEAKMRSVVLLKRNHSNALLKGRESWREFASCPVVDGAESFPRSVLEGIEALRQARRFDCHGPCLHSECHAVWGRNTGKELVSLSGNSNDAENHNKPLDS